MLASELMTNLRENDIELLSDCSVDDVLQADIKLKKIDEPTGLFLNSLLVPILSRSHESLRIRFAHRTYQEFFFALAIKSNREKYKDYALPASVIEHLVDIESEGI